MGELFFWSEDTTDMLRKESTFRLPLLTVHNKPTKLNEALLPCKPTTRVWAQGLRSLSAPVGFKVMYLILFCAITTNSASSCIPHAASLREWFSFKMYKLLLRLKD